MAIIIPLRAEQTGMSCGVVVRSTCVSRLTELSFTATSRLMPVNLHTNHGHPQRHVCACPKECVSCRVCVPNTPEFREAAVALVKSHGLYIRKPRRRAVTRSHRRQIFLNATSLREGCVGQASQGLPVQCVSCPGRFFNQRLQSVVSRIHSDDPSVIDHCPVTCCSCTAPHRILPIGSIDEQ